MQIVKSIKLNFFLVLHMKFALIIIVSYFLS